MNIARPPDGFRLNVRPQVKAQIDELKSQCPWLEVAFADVVARLRMSGHKEGVPSQSVPGLRSVVEVDPISGQRRLGLSYGALGDELTIYAIRVLAFNAGEENSN